MGRRKPRGPTADEDDVAETIRVIMAIFWHRGRPSFRSIREVAEELGIPFQRVTNRLHRAFELGMFGVNVALPSEQQDLLRLEAAVAAEFNLKRVRLVPGFPDILAPNNPIQRRKVHDAVIRTMARATVEHLGEIIAARASCEQPALQIGVAWGRTLSIVAEQMRATAWPGQSRWIRFIPIIGITASENRKPVEANIIAMNLAQAVGGEAEQLPCPACVPRSDYEQITRTPLVQNVLRRLPQCDVVITSMGAIPDANQNGVEIRLSNDPALSRKIEESARSSGAVGDICLNLFDGEGNEVRCDYAAVGLDYRQIKTIAAAPQRDVILVVGGNRRRFESLRAALRGGLASVLISDTVTARWLIGEQPTV